jgi:carbon monoxide dehydrogenase subunit G
MRLKTSICIEAPKEQVWDVLSDIENISLWSDAVTSAKADSDARAVGVTRTCQLKNNTTIFERWIDWREGESYTYQGFNLPLVKTAQNKWSVDALSEGTTLLTTVADVELKGGRFGRFLEPLVRLMSAKMGNQALASFKYLVEQGKPFDSQHASLPRPSAIC